MESNDKLNAHHEPTKQMNKRTAARTNRLVSIRLNDKHSDTKEKEEDAQKKWNEMKIGINKIILNY